MATWAGESRAARDTATVLALVGRRPLAVIARRTHRTIKGLRRFMDRQGIAYSRDCGYITAQCLATEFVARTPQQVSSLCRSGAIPALRAHPRTAGATRGWWLIDLDLVPALQDRYGARGARVNWDRSTRRHCSEAGPR